MNLAPSHPAASRALSLRIDRVLARLAQEAKQFDPYAAERVQLAIDCLDAGAIARGEDAIQYAERAIERPWEQQANLPNSLSTKILRHRLEIARRAAGVMVGEAPDLQCESIATIFDRVEWICCDSCCCQIGGENGMAIDEGSPKKVRQLVVSRLQAMLRGLERARRQPNRREAYYMCQAIEHLEADRLSESEEAVLRAAHMSPLPADQAKKTESNRPSTIIQLRQALDRLTEA